MGRLPVGWKKVKLEQFAFVNMGQSPKGIFVNQNGDGLPFYQGKAEFGKLYPKPRKNCTKPTKIAETNDILLSIRAPVGPTNLCPEESCIGRGLAAIKCYEKQSQRYLLYYFNNIEPWLSRQGTGSTFRAISGSFLKDVEVRVAPLNEQIRIANKLDSLLAKVEAAQTRLDKIPTLLKRFRQSVLAAATSGELTKEWRKDNAVGNVNEIYIECLEKITDKKALNFAKKEFYENEITFTTPHNWKWVRLSAIAEIVSGLAKGSKTKEEVINLPYLRVANVQRGYLDLENIKIIPVPQSRAKKLYLQKGDVLFNEGGDIDKLGRGWVWDGQIEKCVHQNHVFRARVLSDNILPKYISYYGNESARNYFLRGGTQTVNLANLNKTTLSLLPVPLPPIEEQKQIVKQVESLFTLANQVEKQYQQARLRTDKLSQSLLAKAFKGELVPQDPNDEPAEKLLARIQEKRETLKPAKKSHKAK